MATTPTSLYLVAMELMKFTSVRTGMDQLEWVKMVMTLSIYQLIIFTVSMLMAVQGTTERLLILSMTPLHSMHSISMVAQEMIMSKLHIRLSTIKSSGVN